MCGIQNIGLTASTSPQYTLMNTPTSATLDPGSTRVLGVRSTPTAVGQYVGTVEFATTDPALSSPVSVEFPAQGVAASHPLGIRPSIIDRDGQNELRQHSNPTAGDSQHRRITNGHGNA